MKMLHQISVWVAVVALGLVLKLTSLGLHHIGHLKIMSIMCRPSNPRMLKEYAFSTEALEPDLALTPIPDPVISASSLTLAHLPVSEPGGEILWTHFLKPLTNQAVTDQICLDKDAM